MTREGFPSALHGSSTDVSSPGRRWLRLLGGPPVKHAAYPKTELEGGGKQLS